MEKVIKEKVDNVYAQECGLYSDKYMVSGRVDCIAEYDGVLSIIDFKTSRSERNDDWNESYYIQASAYAEMFEERTGTPIEQIVILVVTEDGVVQEFIKNKTDYLPKLINAVDDFTQDWEKENEKLDESFHYWLSCLVEVHMQRYQRNKKKQKERVNFIGHRNQ